MESRTKNVSRNLVWGFLNKFILVIAPFMTRTVMIYTMGSMYIGLNGLFTSILQVLNMSELGISSAIVFNMYKPLAEGNDVEVCALMNFYRKCYRIIGFVLLIIGLVMLLFLDMFIAGDVPVGINIYVLYIMNLCNTFLTYELFGYRSALLIAAQRNDVVSKVSLLVEFSKSVLQAILLIIFKNYYVYVMVIIGATIVNSIIAAIVSKKVFPQYRCVGNISKKQFVQIKTKVGGMIFQKIGGIVLTSVDTIVISAFLGLSILGVYQNYYYIITSLLGFFSVIQTSLISAIGNSVVVESVEKNYCDFKKFNFLYVWVAAWCSICVICLSQPFMRLWVGKNLMLSDGMVVLFGIYLFIYKWGDMAYIYQEACGIWWETRFIPLIAAVMNLILNIILVQKIGLAGILLSTIIAILFVYNTGIVHYLYKLYFDKVGTIFQYIKMQSGLLIIVALAGLATVFVCKFIDYSPIYNLLLRGCICIVLPNIIIGLIIIKISSGRQALVFVKEYIIKNKLKNR